MNGRKLVAELDPREVNGGELVAELDTGKCVQEKHVYAEDKVVAMEAVNSAVDVASELVVGRTCPTVTTENWQLQCKCKQ